MQDIVLLGMGGHAKTIVDTIEELEKYNIIGFLDKTDENKALFQHYHIIGKDDNAKDVYENGCTNAHISLGYLGNSVVRENLYKKLVDMGYKFPPIIDKTAIVSRYSQIGDGTYIGKRSVLNPDVIIGKMCIINTGAVIEHDCIVGDFAHIAGKAIVCGGCKIGKQAFVGANATVIQGVEIGEKAVVGAGAIVLKDVPAGAKVVGVYKG